MTNAIETKGLTKDYGSGRGVFDLDLTVNEGQVFGYLGPNGAGKTTTIKLLMGAIHATRGSAAIFGLDADRDAVAVKKQVGYVPGELPQFGGWRGTEIVTYLAGIRGDVDDTEVGRVAKRLDLDLSRKYREYSHGNK
ncbi:MAG TPA: ATP-binding cassette domain-containing protein, partial [Verrucomicrobiae bacterium]|nr:ATP-binding cassette domain-containing protein [Verrucomicrobiae bacterium]